MNIIIKENISAEDNVSCLLRFKESFINSKISISDNKRDLFFNICFILMIDIRDLNISDDLICLDRILKAINNKNASESNAILSQLELSSIYKHKDSDTSKNPFKSTVAW